MNNRYSERYIFVLYTIFRDYMNTLMASIALLRPKQWAKNFFIFIPAFFAGVIFHIVTLTELAFGFFLFSAAASSIYILNDILDVESDRQHLTKCKRPIASGVLPVPLAIMIAIVLSIGSSVITWRCLHASTASILIGYLLLNVAYCFKIKHIAIIDVVFIALGFVFRVFFGAFIAGVQPSSWLVLMTFLLSLFIGFAKRRDDVIIFEESGKRMRKSIDGYNRAMIDTLLSITATILIISYIMYTQSAEALSLTGVKTTYLYTTSIFVIIGLFRYIQLAVVHAKTGSPTKVLFSDRMIQGAVLGWITCLGGMIYLR